MKVLSENRKAHFNYQILEKYEAGIALNGQEVKSIKLGRINLMGSYVIIRNSEVYLIGASVPPYQPKNAPSDYDPQRTRKLLLRKTEIDYLLGKSQQKGLTMIPLKVYTNNGKIKVEFGLGKGKKMFDKRETIKKRETEKEMKRELKIRG
ncbi:MAG: SsrA-binding protein SmpB [Candidatus Nealsonbacteria bacterium]|nr:SsrA-binding protein SmpB [Candidatus Nealsonbacteria bacterium]